MDQLPRAVFTTAIGYAVQYRQPDVGELDEAGATQCSVCDRPFYFANMQPGNGFHPVALLCRHVYCERCVSQRVDTYKNPAAGCYVCTELDVAYMTMLESVKAARNPEQKLAAAPVVVLPLAEGEEAARNVAVLALCDLREGVRINNAPNTSQLPAEDVRAAEMLVQMSEQDRGLAAATAGNPTSQEPPATQLDSDAVGAQTDKKAGKTVRRSKRLAK